uniref:Prokaryotic-type class I peptide chain release factors domain-containing protein n=2 Tax=Rhodosorus marinus TaxID=101924 RepID=A0A7S3A4I2_9RHOD|mmetsp:Transcript_42465/g.165780  ORF Transcript_42465/g.165780 Transcript_42465/m.165780 type:complete len:155 (+) Transcript_42465:93-557(+)
MLRRNPTVVVIGLALRRLSLFRGFISTNPCLSDRKPQPPKLNPEDVEYKYMRGSGPGGQAMQKSSNAVVAKHLPTGIQSRSHETRSVLRNKSLALASLEFKVDDHFRGEFSAKSILDENRRKKKLSKMRKTKKKLRKLKERQSESTTDDSQSFY